MLNVIHHGVRVGCLTTDGRELTFAYSAAWLDKADAFALMPTLPLREAPYRGDVVSSFFANLLPEGHTLEALCRLQRLPRGNIYRILEAFGDECAGAFEVVTSDNAIPPKAPHYLPYTKEALASDLSYSRDRVPLLQRHGELRLSLAGAQNKMPVFYRDGELFLPANGAPSNFILKPALQPERMFPDSVANEAVSLLLARAVGIPVPDAYVITDPEPFLLIQRYDRVERADGVVRLHQLDFCQLTGVLPEHKYEGDGGPGFKAVFDVIDRHSELPAVDRLQLVDWLLFNFVIGNADAHGKNVSLLCRPDGRWRLAPAYDLLSLTYWPQLSQNMAMAIGGEKRPAWIMTRHWHRLCDSIGLNVSQLRRRALALAESATRQLPGIVDSLGGVASPRLAESLHRTIEQRAGWLHVRLTTDAG
ncbi:type II toxin-antitoxin system HipA family toxin [Tahibacter amnicola]|uniref:Type II toxin-antitoxin system HipA family toxin n=1 Tax=Tahibacter amnicola TaxID=2976241 RepID=A0ABY6BJL2_9GAMM|nr:type II toxin-antitoxin system HipA family toxin [Tahibacter amnicola]UXI68801.1 type II toxin-antitoxin system HipA family toxin [Tahibacter amnicola]